MRVVRKSPQVQEEQEVHLVLLTREAAVLVQRSASGGGDTLPLTTFPSEGTAYSA